jgi:hypothetical protein
MFQTRHFFAIAAGFALTSVIACSASDNSGASTGDEQDFTGRACGGLAGLACPKGYTCDFGTHPIPDQTGKCKKQHTCVQNVICAISEHFDTSECKCVPNSCIDNVLCAINSHWDSAACKCVPN